MKRLVLFLGHRLLFLLPQLVGILLISFVLVKAIPGDPAVLMLGPTASDQTVSELRGKLGLDKPLPVQFLYFLDNLRKGDLGTSWQTTRPVAQDLMERFPATLELVTFSLMLAIAIGLPLGVAAATNHRSWFGRLADLYGLAAGAMPDFWLGLVLIFVFYTIFQVVPAPLGRLDMMIIPPAPVTGFMTVDTLIAGDLGAFASAAAHLFLPVLTLGLVSAGPILKMAFSSTQRMLAEDFTSYAIICGLPRSLITRRALRNALPSIVTIISVLYGYLLGGAVLVEIVFSWGGAGQYAVQGVLNSDIYPVLGFVLFSAVFSLIIYLIVDLVDFVIDPRVGR
ncbi:ABC transporter permease [Aminobacter sp. MSH1]|uniref:ABC transporter permease n=1 Tax=Aminobacter sp. MSH1 TaxID=374606 RepID=UPI001FDFAE58|nr:ABC transporter permease [Aminobacter sp. MSH1]